jgi:predicted secreted hydrolase
LVDAAGKVTHLTVKDYRITPTETWRSPHTDAEYPSGWLLTINPPGEIPLTLTISPLMRDQELNTTTAYWEGASRITGTQGDETLSGYGYVELTGYNRAVANRADAYNRE